MFKRFSFLSIPIDVLKYYNSDVHMYALVLADERIIHDDDKSVTNQLTVIKLMTREELIQVTNGPFVRFDGSKCWYQNGQLHRLDGPAIESVNGEKKWYQNGQYHRLDGPAVEYSNGGKEWYQNGQHHREDGPAIEYPTGYKEWYQNGFLHRLDGPAIEYADGCKEWYQNGNFHRRALGPE